AFAATQREDRTRGRAPYSGQSGELGKSWRKFAPEFVADAYAGPMHVARTRVIAEPGPQVEHVIDGCIGKRTHGWKSLQEALVVGNDRRDLRLLQHDLRHPHAIGRAVALPGKIVSALAGVPLDQCGRDGGCAHCSSSRSPTCPSTSQGPACRDPAAAAPRLQEP